jgi:hypothetical protein
MAIIKEGFLKKQGIVAHVASHNILGHSWHTWKQRWFVLSSDQTLKYFVKQNVFSLATLSNISGC